MKLLLAAVAGAIGAVVVVTAANGASAAAGGETVTIAREPVAAIDTTGAGDAFAATLIGELLHAQWPPARPLLARALATAASVATAVALVPGAQARVDGER